MTEFPLHPVSRARHDLRNPISDILGFSEMLGEEAVRVRRTDLAAGLQAIYQAGLQMLRQVNQGLELEQLKLGSAHLPSLWLAIQASSQKIIALAEELSARPDPDGNTDFANDLSRITNAAQLLLARAPVLLRPLMDTLAAVAGLPAPEPEIETRALPMSPDGQATIHPSQAGPATGVASSELTTPGRQAPPAGAVLVVEDNESNRELLARRLRQQGHDVLVAESGAKALELLRANPFDLVILDFMMPEMNGYEVLAKMKADANLRHIPVIMLSGLDDLGNVVQCIERGADDYLTKPFDPVFLRARVGACLEKKRWRDREAAFLRQIEREKQRADHFYTAQQNGAGFAHRNGASQEGGGSVLMSRHQGCSG